MRITKLGAALFTGLMVLLSLPLMAQPGPPPPGAGAPVDGGLIMLVAGAAIYGYGKLKESKAEPADKP